MNFDLPAQTKPWENKKSPVFKEWLKKQIQLDSSKWGQDFKLYIKQVEEDSKEKNVYSEPTEKEKREETFNRYLNALEISQEDLKGKKVLDVGCGNGDFVISCLEKGITDEVYGLDSNPKGDARDPKYRSHFFYKDFSNVFPIENLDYVVSVGAISLYLYDKELQVDIEEAIKSSIRSVNENGEVRIWPIKKFIQGTDSDGIKEQEQLLLSVMEYVSECLDIEWRLDPTDIRACASDKDIWADQVLIIKKNPKAKL